MTSSQDTNIHGFSKGLEGVIAHFLMLHSFNSMPLSNLQASRAQRPWVPADEFLSKR